QVRAMALELGVIGLMNVQFAIQNGLIYILEVNPRASRTVPFVSKCIGRSLAKVAARCMAGTSLQEQGFTSEIIPDYFSVKEAVFPFGKFPGVDPILGPEMKSTGEVMGVGKTFGEAYRKSQLAAGDRIPSKGRAFLSVRDVDKPEMLNVARDLIEIGYTLVATRGTARALKDAGIEVEVVNKVQEGRPHVVDMLKNQEISFIVNTTEGKQAIADSFEIRRTALQYKVYNATTMAGARACIDAVHFGEAYTVHCLQDLHKRLES
ncbi:MAG: carbamoyl phosphate synthase large subunit, partial [Pseudomonadales bacterium]|nr:carbamoyl phosphate synthase large subunit [Pseudomonadales bacterium]